jgi:Predicted membrane protein (DUF2142)
VAEPLRVSRRGVRAAWIRGKRLWLWAFVGLFLLLGAWAVAAPYSGYPDERDHILRAYGVVTGQVVLAPAEAAAGGGAFVDVPRSLLVPQCWQFHSDVPASCAPEPGGDETVARAGTAAGRYFPLYYALVGAPLALSPDWTGVLLARLLSVALCAALLANALTDAIRYTRHRLLLAGVLVATTPMVAHMGGAVNPSGLELAAGVAFFTAVIPLLFTERDGNGPEFGRDSRLLWHAGVAALALATIRMLGPLWLVSALVALLLPWRRATLRQIWSWKALRYWVFGVAGAGAVGTAWALLSKATEPNPFFVRAPDLGPAQIVWSEIQRWPGYISEMVGVTSWLDAKMPEMAYVLWPVLVGALVLWGYVFGDRLSRWRLITLGAAGVLVPLAIAVRYTNTFGFITQGRYLLPLLAGVPILGAFLIGENGLAPDRSRVLIRLYVVVLLPIHLLALAFTMMRWQRGQAPGTGLNPLTGPWHPPLGSVTPLVVAIFGIAAIGALAWTAAQVSYPAATSVEPATQAESKGPGAAKVHE